MLDLVGNPEDRFSHNEGHFMEADCITNIIYVPTILPVDSQEQNLNFKNKILAIDINGILKV